MVQVLGFGRGGVGGGGVCWVERINKAQVGSQVSAETLATRDHSTTATTQSACSEGNAQGTNWDRLSSDTQSRKDERPKNTSTRVSYGEHRKNRRPPATSTGSMRCMISPHYWWP